MMTNALRSNNYTKTNNSNSIKVIFDNIIANALWEHYHKRKVLSKAYMQNARIL